jgi:CheY-like chemotaxis protein
LPVPALSKVSDDLANKQSVVPEREREVDARESDTVTENTGAIESRDTIENAFMTRVATKFAILKDLIRSTSDTEDEITRQETLAEFYLGLHELSSEADSDVNQPARQLKAALEGLVRKLLESPDNWTHSMLLTISNAVDLMDDLCAGGSIPDIVGKSPVKILAVDDDPISRRAMSGALQVSFKKPFSAESGQAALVMASQQKFDLIFMDVQMPGMDGFETCSKLRETETNSRTPVVFVTSKNDFHTRNQAAASGGDGIISKPFLTAELTVKALTSAWRGRIELIDSHGTSPFDRDNAATHPATA